LSFSSRRRNLLTRGRRPRETRRRMTVNDTCMEKVKANARCREARHGLPRPAASGILARRAALLAGLWTAGAPLVLAEPPGQTAAPPAFSWPAARRGALSLTFDDARESQVDVGLPLLDSLGVRATFYVLPENARKRLDGWRAAAKRGHEIGNHSSTHPCTGNFAFSRRNALEDYTLALLERNLSDASLFVEREIGTRPVSFAYPCGQTFVGRGEDVRSYVPVVAHAFHSGRLYLGEDANDPAFCDFAQLLAVGLDGLSFDEVRPFLERAAAEGRWLILAGHEIGESGPQTTRTATLAAICRHAKDPANGLFVDTVETVAAHVRASRRAGVPLH
jgi:peptidoglycan/xylan/chitin deacetylase (PgdA/CDA1 family)